MINLEKTLRVSLAYLLSAAALVLGTSAIAQDEVETAFNGFKKITVQQRADALNTINEPFSKKDSFETIKIQVENKLAASDILGSQTFAEKIYRDAINFLPYVYLKNNLALILVEKGDFEEANLLFESVVLSTSDQVHKTFYKLNQASTYYKQFRDTEARLILDNVYKEIVYLEKAILSNDIDRLRLLEQYVVIII
jgi:tetratricopeptide (TPR) repeat protein